MSHTRSTLSLLLSSILALNCTACSQSSDSEQQTGINAPEHKISVPKKSSKHKNPGIYPYRGVIIPESEFDITPEYFYFNIDGELAFFPINPAEASSFPEDAECISMKIKARQTPDKGLSGNANNNKTENEQLKKIFSELIGSNEDYHEALYLTSDNPGASSMAIILTDNYIYGKLIRNGKEYTMTSPDGEYAEYEEPITVRNIKYDNTILTGPQYSAKNLFDHNYSTCWAVSEDKAKNSKELYNNNTIYSVSFTVDKDDINLINIFNGYHKSEALLHANARPTWIRITASSDKQEEITLYEGELSNIEYPEQPQQIYIWRNLNGHNNIKIYINPNDIIPGRKYNDICISEIEIY